jgi:hypothetical protein
MTHARALLEANQPIKDAKNEEYIIFTEKLKE